MTIRPTRRNFVGGLTALLFAGFAGKKVAVAAAPPPLPLPQPLPTTYVCNDCGSLPDQAVLVSISTYNYSGRLLTSVEGQGNTGNWIYDGTNKRTRK
jgi:hypothetical protein